MKNIHHIIPRHMGGTDEPTNLIELTVEEHAEAHRLLYEQHGHWQDYCAWQALSGRMGQEEILRYKQGMANKGRKRTPEQIEKCRQSALARIARQRADGTFEAANKKRSEAMKGKKKSEEHMANWVESRKGHIVTEEHREKTRQSLAKTRANKKALPK